MALPAEISVVLADDNPLIRKGIRAILSRHPRIRLVGEAATGIEAIQQVEEHEPQVLLLDISMPVMDGIDAALLLIPLYPNVRILMMSAYNDIQVIQEVYRCGCAGYILKELAPKDLIDTIWNVMSSWGERLVPTH